MYLCTEVAETRFLLSDGPRGSLQRLRSQLAKDGCPESQLQLARLLLDEQCGMYSMEYFKINIKL